MDTFNFSIPGCIGILIPPEAPTTVMVPVEIKS